MQDYYEQEKQNQINNNLTMITREIKDIFKYQKLIKNTNLIKKRDCFELEITIFKDYIKTDKDINLLIVIPFNYPKSEPEIYCLTEFCHPHICDGRDLLFDIIKNEWQKNIIYNIQNDCYLIQTCKSLFHL